MTVYETMTSESTLRLPIQSAPIDRTPSGAAAFGSAAGVEAAGWFDDLVGTATKYGPSIVSGLGSLGI
jgi:hypothetical protein